MTNWKKTYSTWFNVVTAAASALLAVALYLQTQAVPWAPLAIVGITAFTVFLRSLPQGEKPTKEPVRVEERGFVGIKLMLVASLLGVVLCAVFPVLAGCSPQQTAKTASHLASNSAAEALSWIDARLAAQYEVASDAELARLSKANASLDAYETWRTESGWAATIQAVALGRDAHALLVAHLDGTKPSTDEDRRQALEALTKAVQLGLTLLEQERVQVPPYVRTAAAQLPALGALL